MGYVVANRGGGDELFSSPANRMFVDANHFGQAVGALNEADDARIKELLPSHGFDVGAVEVLRQGDREALIRHRLTTLIQREREFMERKQVQPPTARIAAAVADSEASDRE